MTRRDLHQAVAQQLHDWFHSVLRVTDKSLFGIVPAGPYRGAVVLDVMTRNARILAESEIDNEGKLYAPICFFLAAACRRLGTALGVGHWRADVDNVIHLQEQRVSARAESATVGLELGSPARLFKQQLDEAIIQAGLAGGPSYFDRENREIALGLAINWGLRLLLAYALEGGRSLPDSNRKDLAWVASLLAPLPAASPSESR